MVRVVLELVAEAPDWGGALALALTRPPGVPERRAGQDHWHPDRTVERPRRISDDLAWFREAVDEPNGHGLERVDGLASAWQAPDGEPAEQLLRLRERGVLRAAGFELHEPDA